MYRYIKNFLMAKLIFCQCLWACVHKCKNFFNEISREIALCTIYIYTYGYMFYVWFVSIESTLDIIISRANIIVLNVEVTKIDEHYITRWTFWFIATLSNVVMAFSDVMMSVLFREIVSLHKMTREVLTTRVVDVS